MKICYKRTFGLPHDQLLFLMHIGMNVFKNKYFELIINYIRSNKSNVLVKLLFGEGEETSLEY